MAFLLQCPMWAWTERGTMASNSFPTLVQICISQLNFLALSPPPEAAVKWIHFPVPENELPLLPLELGLPPLLSASTPLLFLSPSPAIRLFLDHLLINFCRRGANRGSGITKMSKVMPLTPRFMYHRSKSQDWEYGKLRHQLLAQRLSVCSKDGMGWCLDCMGLGCGSHH